MPVNVQDPVARQDVTDHVNSLNPHPITEPIATSPDGSKWQIVIDNQGIISATKIA